MTTINEDQHAIVEVVKLYFKGTYEGNTKLLQQAFHPAARITGSIRGQIHDWALAEFITRVTTSPTAKDQQDKYDKEILAIDYTHHAAMVKARVVVNGLVFIDYITLLKIDGHWVIRNKSFTTE